MKKQLYYGILGSLILVLNLTGCKIFTSTSAKELTGEKKSPPITERIQNPFNKRVEDPRIANQSTDNSQTEEDFWIGKYCER